MRKSIEDLARICVLASMPLLAGISLVMPLGADDSLTAQAKRILAQKCVGCHSGDDLKGMLDLTTRESLLAGGDSGPAIELGKASQSLLWQRVNRDEMPPKLPLTAEEKQSLAKWIEAGAPWTGGRLDPMAFTSDHRAGLNWWSLLSLRSVQVPNITGIQTIPRQPIDEFVLEKLRANRLEMSSETDRRVLLRRLSFNLLGLPPAPEEIDQFVGDPNPDAFERQVDRMLSSPHYGERWARHWLDVVRFGESNGFERDLPRPNAWPYRDWVIDALNRDLPYDEFVQWQLAGDLFHPNDPDSMKAVGFLVAGAHDTVIPVADRMRALMRQDELEDLVGTVSQSFLGLTLNCARCHDHKFDPITSREYYQFASALAGIDHGEREVKPPSVTNQLSQWQLKIDELTKQLRDQESPIRARLLAERQSGLSDRPAATSIPLPLAAWDFTRDLRDQSGKMDVTLVGSAKRNADGLTVDGASFARSSRLPHDVLEKTLEVKVRLKSLQQAGGGVICLQSQDGQVFDAIVFAEQEPGKWMAGSEGFQRTSSFQGSLEEQADQEPVVVTQVYLSDGTIRGYRNGQSYGVPIRKNSAVKFEANSSFVVFGLRHGSEAGGNRMLKGTICSARIYDRALSPEEVLSSAISAGVEVSETDILSRLDDDEATLRKSRQNELVQLRQKHAELTKSGTLNVYTAIATQPGPMKVHQRGSVSSLGDEVEPAGLKAIQGLSPEFGLRPDAIESHRRRQLAYWITDQRNPLFSRVIVNRVWHYHFGSGLVESPNDLGFHAGNPSHPELLEWLTGEFQALSRRPRTESNDQRELSRSVTPIDSGSFSLKRLHRQIVTSATYRQSSAIQAAAAKMDSGNRLLWRVNPRRLEAEELRDAMLMIADQFNNEVGGKGYTDLNSYFFKGTQFYDPIDPVGHSNHRRTIYRMWARGGRSPFLDNFDCPDPSTTTPRRSSTVTPLQALSLLNNSFGLRMANHFAERLQALKSPSPDVQVENAYRLLFGRRPDADEIRLSVEFISRRGLPAFCRAMWNSSEFLFLD